jgi:hypothetical protein
MTVRYPGIRVAWLAVATPDAMRALAQHGPSPPPVAAGQAPWSIIKERHRPIHDRSQTEQSARFNDHHGRSPLKGLMTVAERHPAAVPSEALDCLSCVL